MGAIGIVAEYNPFHRGHAYHIEETQRLLGTNKPVICVMSGNWVQRGECALVDKWTRAEMALRGGADLILELPLPWAVSSAERFAQGAIAILKETGVVDTLSFGSESGLVEDLREVAKCLESEAYQNALHTELGKGIPFAEARQKAAVQVIGKKAEKLGGANDSLGVEYLRRACDDWKIVTVRRKGIDHDSCCATADYASASYLRQKLRVGEDVSPWVESVETLQRADFAKMENIERAILTRLRQMEERDFAALPDSGVAEGFPARLVKAARNANSLEEFYTLAKTKRYAHARIRRLAVWAFLGITEAERLMTEPAYLRVLGMNERGICLLREMKQKATLPILTKPAHIRNMRGNAQRLFALESRGTDLFMLALDAVQPCGKEFTTNPFIL